MLKPLAYFNLTSFFSYLHTCLKQLLQSVTISALKRLISLAINATDASNNFLFNLAQVCLKNPCWYNLLHSGKFLPPPPNLTQTL